jgi:hypothetical protein
MFDNAVDDKNLDDEDRELNPLEKRDRNVNVEEFAGFLLCRASLALLLQTNYSTLSLPIGQLMRVLLSRCLLCSSDRG